MSGQDPAAPIEIVPVANGWVVQPAMARGPFHQVFSTVDLSKVRVAATAEELAKIVRAWATTAAVVQGHAPDGLDGFVRVLEGLPTG